jgi:D-glycero-D-manno-heptose 1,7-bisphosphate phosphatase
MPQAEVMRTMQSAVFLDRDGTLMEDTGYVRRASDVRLYPGVGAALTKLKAAGFILVIVTNQSGIGRGIFSEAEYHAVHREVLRQLGGELIDATYFCPEHPGAATERRKPAPGMLLEAARDLAIDLAQSFMIGDKAADAETGRRAGLAASILVRTGVGEAEAARAGADYVADDLPAAAAWILQRARKCG